MSSGRTARFGAITCVISRADPVDAEMMQNVVMTFVLLGGVGWIYFCDLLWPISAMLGF